MNLLGRLNRSGLSAGLTDSAFSSLATFLIGLYATHNLNGDGLGLYAIAFSGFLVASMASTQSFLLPAEVANLALPQLSRPALLKSSVVRSVPVAVVWAAVVAGVLLVIPTEVTWSNKSVLVATLFATSIVSPLQDHARRIFHQGRESWTSALLSFLQLFVVALCLRVGTIAGVSDYALPFASLGIANAVGLGAALFLVRDRPSTHPDLNPIRLFTTGRWFLAAGICNTAVGFISVIMLSAVAGAVYAGRGEAVRVLSQPLFVLAAGLSAVLGPRAMEAAQQRDRATAARHSNRFMVALLGITLVYAFLIGPRWPGTPMPDWFPAAYEDPGLLFLSVLLTGAGYALGVRHAELVGGGRQVVLASVSATAAAVQLTATAISLPLNTYSLMVGAAAGLVVRWVWTSRALRHHYGPIASDAGGQSAHLLATSETE